MSTSKIKDPSFLCHTRTPNAEYKERPPTSFYFKKRVADTFGVYKLFNSYQYAYLHHLIIFSCNLGEVFLGEYTNISFRNFPQLMIMAPPFPIRQPTRDVGTSNLVANDIRPESFSTFSLHLGCKRNAASTVGENVSLKN